MQQQQRLMRPSVRDTCGVLGCSLAVMALFSAVPGGEAFLCPMAVKGVASSPGGLAARKGQQQEQRLATRYEKEREREGRPHLSRIYTGGA